MVTTPTNPMAETTPTQVRLDPKRVRALQKTAKLVGLTVPNTHRLALDYGLPVLVDKLAKK
jgi:hypothetical protein